MKKSLYNFKNHELIGLRCIRRLTMRDDYVHGYSKKEAQRLVDQAKTLADLMHHDTRYPSGSKVLTVPMLKLPRLTYQNHL